MCACLHMCTICYKHSMHNYNYIIMCAFVDTCEYMNAGMHGIVMYVCMLI